MYDLIIRNGTVLDGSGKPEFKGDIAIKGRTIAAVGEVSGEANNELDADGLLVTPGFVDIHTHYDGQATWDSLLSPSVYHGVTTVVMGNCGVGFAPVKAEQRDWLISLMEGVEDIPGTALAEGIDWRWESFPEFLDTLDSKQHTIDIAAQLPHGALRTYVMGKRGGIHEEKPSAEEIDRMASLAEEAVEAGALGFTSSRTINHKTSDGVHTPSLTASADELWGIAEGLKRAGKGVIQLISDFDNHDEEFEMIREMAAKSGRPLSFSLNQLPEKPDEWQRSLELTTAANDEGITIKAQVAPRPVGVLLSLQSTYHPFILCPSFQPLIGQPVETQLNLLQADDDSLKEKLVQEWQEHALFDFDNIWVFENPPEYEPDPKNSITALASADGIAPALYALNTMMSDGGTGMLYYPALNFVEKNSEVSRQLLLHKHTVPGLGDGGAHVSFISDASFCTYLLTHWARDRQNGDKIPLPYLIKSQTRDCAEVVGLNDRGLLQAGMKADINIIDFDALQIGKPAMIQDLPAGGHRLMQKASGYEYMIVSGEVVMHKGEPTGQKPGQLVRGAQTAPASS